MITGVEGFGSSKVHIETEEVPRAGPQSFASQFRGIYEDDHQERPRRNPGSPGGCK